MVYVLSHRIDPSAMKKSVPVDQLQYSTMGQDTIPEQQTQPVCNGLCIVSLYRPFCYEESGDC